MKRILATLILTCALSVSALAGEIPTCSPSPTAAVTGEVPTNDSESAGNMPTDGATGSSEGEASVLTTVLLSLATLIVS
jgi:hypothetical protein